MKQQTLAGLLKVSQGYVSRLEGDTAVPAADVEERVRRLLASPEHLPFVEQVALAVRLSPHMVCLIVDIAPFTLIASSGGNDAACSPFTACDENSPLDQASLEEFRLGLQHLSDIMRDGAPAGPAGQLWHSLSEKTRTPLKSVHIPLKVAHDRWVWHSTSVFISQEDFADTETKWGGALAIDAQHLR